MPHTYISDFKGFYSPSGVAQQNVMSNGHHTPLKLMERVELTLKPLGTAIPGDNVMALDKVNNEMVGFGLTC